MLVFWQETYFSELDLSNTSLWHDIWSAACYDDADMVTPPQKLLDQAVVVEQDTPPRVPKPCSKLQLQAAKKLEAKFDAAAKPPSQMQWVQLQKPLLRVRGGKPKPMPSQW